MNHNAIAHALCGTYTRLSDRSGYIESPMAYPSDGTLIGAYVVDAGNGLLHVTDDGDIAFHMAVAGAEISSNRLKTYQATAASFGISFGDDGVVRATCAHDQLIETLARYLQAASAVTIKGLKHRPKDDERFERVVLGLLLARYGDRVRQRVQIMGLSGHQLRFPFSITTNAGNEALIQTVSSVNEVIHWKAVYEAGGKFKDVRAARPDAPLIAILEGSRDAQLASRYFSDTASVLIYEGGPLDLDFALAA